MSWCSCSRVCVCVIFSSIYGIWMNCLAVVCVFSGLFLMGQDETLNPFVWNICVFFMNSMKNCPEGTRRMKWELKVSVNWILFFSSRCRSGGLAAESGDPQLGAPCHRGDPAVWDGPAGGQPDHLPQQGKGSNGLGRFPDTSPPHDLHVEINSLVTGPGYLSEAPGKCLVWPWRSSVRSRKYPLMSPCLATLQIFNGKPALQWHWRHHTHTPSREDTLQRFTSLTTKTTTKKTQADSASTLLDGCQQDYRNQTYWGWKMLHF